MSWTYLKHLVVQTVLLIAFAIVGAVASVTVLGTIAVAAYTGLALAALWGRAWYEFTADRAG